MTSKILDSSEHIYSHLHNFCVLDMGCFVSSAFFFLNVGFKKIALFCAQTPCMWGYIGLDKQAQQSLDML